MADKIRVATTSLVGCFGCHMSLLDIDERMLQLADMVEFNRSPITDIKQCTASEIGLIEGGVCNADNVHVLREFRKNCKTLVAVGACAINGGLPAMRNDIPVEECLQEAYLNGIGTETARVPNDPELPLLGNSQQITYPPCLSFCPSSVVLLRLHSLLCALRNKTEDKQKSFAKWVGYLLRVALLNKVYPIHEVVKVDYFLPGCPPSADVFWKFLTDLMAGQEPSLPYELVHYD